YNVGQVNENDNNKNRQYPVVDARVRDTYAAASAATNKNALYDAYVKFFRWATDRLEGRDGIVCFVSNSGFIDGVAFDGMRKHLLQDFNRIYILDLTGNARTSGERRRREGGNVFLDQIRVGVSITIAIRHHQFDDHRVYYHRVGDYLSGDDKLAFLEAHTTGDGQPATAIGNIQWQRLIPDARHNWLVSEHAAEFAAGIPMGGKAAKKKQAGAEKTIFSTYARGVLTCRDMHVYDFDRAALISRVRQFIEDYNREVDRYKRATLQGQVNIDDFVDVERVKWDSTLKRHLKSKRYVPSFDESRLCRSLYRPFTAKWLYFEPLLINSIHLQHYFFPTPASEAENRAICVTDKGSEKRFMVMVTTGLIDLHLVGAGSSAQTFPFYVYDADGNNRRENITDWALNQFRQHYGDETITKWDI
ncbi:MAG: DNA helicase, partial [Chloroflexi bacterium]